MQFDVGSKVKCLANFGDNPQTIWYRKGQVLTVRKREADLIGFKEFPQGLFRLSRGGSFSSAGHFMSYWKWVAVKAALGFSIGYFLIAVYLLVATYA